jgi:hypothetical protein
MEAPQRPNVEGRGRGQRHRLARFGLQRCDKTEGEGQMGGPAGVRLWNCKVGRVD